MKIKLDKRQDMAYFDSMKEIESLKQIKARRQISLETMSREIGVSMRTLFRWIHGENNPSMMALKRLDEYIHRQIYGRTVK